MIGPADIWGAIDRLEELIRLAYVKAGSIPASVAGTGFWRSVAGVLQPTASLGLQGQVAGVNAGGSDIAWQAVFNTWTPVAGGGVFTPGPNQAALLVDTTGPQQTIKTPANPYDGQNLIIYDYEGEAALNPILIQANTGVTIDDPSNPGTTPGLSGKIALQGQTAWFKYFAGSAQWQLVAVTSPYVSTPNSWNQAVWFIDPANSSGVASDNNPGTSSGAPLLTWKELVRRWGGTVSPTLQITVTVTFMSSQSGGTDPVIWTPTLITNGTTTGAPVLQGTRTVVATGTLSGVVPKNRTTPQLLNATLAAGLAANQIIQNTTRANSEAKLYALVSGTTWALSQPLTVASVPVNYAVAEVDTWANGDSYTVFSVPSVDVVMFAPLLADFNGTGTNLGVLQNMHVFDPSGLDLEGFTFVSTQCQNAIIDRNLNQAPAGQSTIGPRFQNCACAAGAQVSASPTGGPVFLGGILSAGASGIFDLECADFDLDVIINANAFCHVNQGYGWVYVETGKTLTSVGRMANAHQTSGNVVIWGPGTLDVLSSGTINYSIASTAVITFRIATIHIGGAATAYSALTTAGVTTIHGGIALTAANIDAAAGATGFGGTAFVLGGGSITNGNQN